MVALLGRAKDFRQPDAIADALLHPRDRAYTVPNCMHGSSAAACPSAAGSSRPLIYRSAALWPTHRTPNGLARCPNLNNMRPRNYFAAR